MSIATRRPGKRTFARGVHPRERKDLSASRAIEVFPTPGQIVLALHQHTGAPCQPVVKPKETVQSGQKVADCEAFITAPVHSSVSGTVGRQGVTTLPNGRHVAMLPIVAAGEQLEGQALFDEILGGTWDYAAVEELDPEKIAPTVRDAGIVGLGGAAFPAHVKLTYNPDRPVDTLLLNGCECEPYLTADDRVMIEAPRAVVAGALVAARACRAKHIMIALEENKPLALEALRGAAEGTGIDVVALQTKYPMGGEKQTVLAVTGQAIPTGGLPLDVGVVVVNVGTAVAVARATLRGGSLTHRVLTLSGGGLRKPGNLLVPAGVTYRALLDYCGGVTEETVRVVAGGPMMGFTLGDLDVPVTKGTSGVLALTEKEVKKAEESPCVRCGQCVDVCPLNLVPTRLALAARHKNWDLARRYAITACMECGCCAYTCPSSLPLVQLIRAGKAQLPRE